MKRTVLKIMSLVAFTLGTQSVASECKIITSPLDMPTMTFVYSNWYAQSTPTITASDYQYTSFVDAYKEFDEKLRNHIKETVCKKNHFDGVANYKIQWQQTEKVYDFTATYDVFSDK